MLVSNAVHGSIVWLCFPTYPDFLVDQAFTQTFPDTGSLRSTIRNIVEDSSMSEFSLVRCQPARLQRAIWQREDGDKCNAD